MIAKAESPQTKTGLIQLDNQSIQLQIRMPSGRFQIMDKVSGMTWSMQSGQKSGTVILESNGDSNEFRFGYKGKRGVQFKTNYYMPRSSSEEDFHDVSLTGVMGDDKETSITIRYLLSTTFPILKCFCFIEGSNAGSIKKIAFPDGLSAPDKEGAHILLPKDIKSFYAPNTQHLSKLFWEPDPKENHRVVGTPFFVITRKGSNGKACSCIGFLSHPHCSLEIQRNKTGRIVTPVSTHLDETGKSEDHPYQFRCQFFPTLDLEAIAWLCRERLQEKDEAEPLF